MKRVRHPRINTKVPKRTINWAATSAENNLIHKIVLRFEREYLKASGSKKMPKEYDRMNLTMDIKACHLNGMTLDLVRLHAFPVFDFFHDINGISRHINRETAQIERHFVPRCAS